MKRALPITAAALLILLSGIDVVPVAYASSSGSTAADPLNISQIPLFVSTAAKPNVLLVMANSNSMDENDKGLAVGSTSPFSKSEISRGVAKGLVSRYTGILNMGLAAFQQSATGSDPVVLYNVHNSPYDASFDPTAYDPTFTGARTSATKAFRAPNVSTIDTDDYVYYNVNLPFYSSANEGTGFCYSDTANAFNNGEVLWSGPWDLYACYRNKVGPSNTVPAVADFAGAGAAGYSGLFAFYRFFPTDSDLGQGITDFGKILTWNFVSPAWFSNGSPGKGYIHVPIGSLDVARAAAFNTKLGTSQFAVNGPTDPALPQIGRASCRERV